MARGQASLAGGLLLGALTLGAGPAAGAGPCRVVVSGADAAWTQAAAALEQALAEAGAAGDCAFVIVQQVGELTTVVFSTSDGRRAERVLASTAELEPTVRALAVAGLPAPPAPWPPSGPGWDVPGGRPVPPAAPVAPAPLVAPPAPAPTPALVTLGARGGVRTGAGTLTGSLAEGFATLGLGSWEVGVLGRWEHGYRAIVGADTPRNAGAAAGVLAGRRTPLGADLALVGGLQLVVAHLHVEGEGDGDVGRSEARVGPYLGLAIPRGAARRVRADLALDWVPSSDGHPQRTADGVPIRPWWAAAITVGLELGDEP